MARTAVQEPVKQAEESSAVPTAPVTAVGYGPDGETQDVPVDTRHDTQGGLPGVEDDQPFEMFDGRQVTAWAWRKWPGQRLFTFVDPRKVRSSNPGYCFLVAGWRRLPGLTKRGLIVLEANP